MEEQSTVGFRGSTPDGGLVLESIQFNDEIQGIVSPVPAPENASSFTALLELPPTQAVELLHSPNVNQKPYLLGSFNGNLTFPSNAALIERAAKYSVFAGENNNSPPVKNEPQETDSNPCSTQGYVSDPAVENKNQRCAAAKRKEREKKVPNPGIRVSIFCGIQFLKHEIVNGFVKYRVEVRRRRRVRASPMNPPAVTARSFRMSMFAFGEVKPQIVTVWQKE